MPSKTSKHQRRSPSLKKEERVFSESELIAFARALATELKEGDVLLLEGELGAGKSTFARAILEGLKVPGSFEGSPTFAIAHEYQAPQFSVFHIDFYRLKSLDEIEAAGIPSYFWEKKGVVITEWMSQFGEFREQVLTHPPHPSGKILGIELVICGDGAFRKVSIERLR